MISAGTLEQLTVRFPSLAGVSLTLRERLRTESVLHHAHPGHLLFDDLKPCHSFPMLLTGSLRVFRHSAAGRELRLYRVHGGDICLISLLSKLGKETFGAIGVIEQESAIVLVPPPLFDALVAESAEFRALVMQQFSQRVADLMCLAESVAFQRLDQRIASRLLEESPILHCTHQQLADDLGSVRELVSRQLRRFEESGWVELGREKIIVLEPECLQRILTHRG